MKLFAATLLALVAPSAAAAALEVKLSVGPAGPKAGSQSVVQLRPYWTYQRPNGTCCRLVRADLNYPFKVEAVAPSGRVFRVVVRRTKSSRYVWSGAIVFKTPGRWVVRAPQWGPRYSRNYGAKPRISFAVKPA